MTARPFNRMTANYDKIGMATYEKDDPIWYDGQPYFFRDPGRIHPNLGPMATIGSEIDGDAIDEVPIAKLSPRDPGRLVPVGD